MRVLARHWWLFALRGVLGIIFGLIAFFMPAVTMLSLVFVFAAYAVADGLFAIVAAMRASQHHERWTPFLLEGVVGVAAGIAAFFAGAYSLCVRDAGGGLGDSLQARSCSLPHSAWASIMAAGGLRWVRSHR